MAMVFNATELKSQQIHTEPSIRMNDQDMQTMLIRVKEKVGNLNDNIAFMADKTKKNRHNYKIRAEKLFINNCKSYNEYIYDDNGHLIKTTKRDVIMQIQQIKDKKPTNRRMRDYFYNLINLRYKQVIIESTDYMKMDATSPEYIGTNEEGDSIYRCIVVFDQKFEGQRGENNNVIEYTRKRIDCYIEKHEVIEDYRLKNEYIINLGNVYVESVDSITSQGIIKIK